VTRVSSSVKCCCSNDSDSYILGIMEEVVARMISYKVMI